MKKYLFIALATALIATACNKETEPTGSTPEPAPVEHGAQTFTAVREVMIDNASKAAFNDTENRLDWEVGDSIIISDGTAYSKFYVTEIAEDGTATFAIKEGETELAENATYKAWYPVSFAPDADGKCNIAKQVRNDNGEAPEGQAINYAPSIYSQNPMYAESATTELQFKNTCALIKINIILPEGSADAAFSQIVVESKTSQVFGPGSIAGNAYVPDGAEGYGRCAVTNSNAKWQSAVSTYYIALPAQTYEDLFFMPNTNKKLVQYFPITKPLTLERNNLYTLDLTCDDLRTDLTLNSAPANCYNVKQGTGACMFKATRGCETELLEGIDHVAVLWREQTGATAKDLTDKIIKDVSYSKGYVKFTSANNQGNALIAAYDKDNTIIWSWHIWSTPSLVGTQVLNGKTIIDRNLGAYNNDYYEGGNLTDGSGKFYYSTFCAGLLYQWGRKDPFTGRCNQSGSGANAKLTTPFGTETGTVKTIDTSGPVTIATSIANPTVYYANSGASWCSEEGCSWDGEEKSIYDPCPSGYRVWDKDAWGASPAKSDFTVVSGPANAAGAVIVYGYTNGTAFYATGGQLSSTTGEFGSGMLYSRIWFRDVVDGKVGFYNLAHQDDATAGFSMKTVSVGAGQKMNSSYGMAVRCQKIEN